ncbi:hypothetical protein [Roseovarius sp.]|uniref:hypothetical protein n=1 Tax=Roseovarius sp. TaxID=1486281 RepID=UPI002631739A|nr:hypothetical protein [Roseovarius sp.]MDM8168120.1 hypothetical protein [Roseovarius sp.]
MFRTIAAATLVSTIGLAAYAEEGGELVLEVDGETHAYTLLPSQSDWSGSESFGSASIYALPTDKSSHLQSLMLGFSLAPGGAERGEINLRTVSDGDTIRYYAGDDAEEGGLVVTLDSSSVSGEELSLTGSFQTELGTSDNYGRDIDLSEAMTMQGTFSVVLGPVE